MESSQPKTETKAQITFPDTRIDPKEMPKFTEQLKAFFEHQRELGNLTKGKTVNLSLKHLIKDQ